MSTSCSRSPMPTMMWAPEFLAPKDVARVFQNLPILLPGMRASDTLAACTLEEFGRSGIECDCEISAPKSLRRMTSARCMVVGLERIETGKLAGSIREVHAFKTETVSSSERGCVIIEMHMRWNGVLLPSRATISTTCSIGTAGQSTRMKLRSA